MAQVVSSQGTATFLSLAPDTRNQIYELIYNHHKRTAHAITLCSEKGYREVPHPISRTCRQIRNETLAYFYDLQSVTFVLRDPADLAACRDWISFAPKGAWALIKGIKVKHSHRGVPKGGTCNFIFELDLDGRRAMSPVTVWWDRRGGCGVCSVGVDREGDCVPMVDLVLKEMCAGGAVTGEGIGLVMELLEGWVVD